MIVTKIDLALLKHRNYTGEEIRDEIIDRINAIIEKIEELEEELECLQKQ